MTWAWQVRVASVAVVLGTLLPACGAVAQDSVPPDSLSGRPSIQLLQMASRYEDAGRLAAAEQVYRSILARDPRSLSALLSLERLLRIEGRLPEMIPIVHRHLEAMPASAIGNQMMLRIDSDLHRTKAFNEDTDAWIKAAPNVETPYRESARMLEQRDDVDLALKVLERGRSRLKNDPALASELGYAYALQGRTDEAVSEWRRAVGPDGDGLLLVERRLSLLPDGGASLLPGLVAGLRQDAKGTDGQRAVALLAARAGLGGEALKAAMRAAAGLDGRALRVFLGELVQRSDAAQLPDVELWAYQKLLSEPGAVVDSASVRRRLAELALSVGDTARARRELSSLAEAAEPGSLEKREAASQAIALAVREGDLDSAETALARFQHDFTNASETDGLAAQLAGAILQKGDTAGAARVLADVKGPQSDFVRGRIALERGDVAGARTDFLSAAPGLFGGTATEAIVLGRLLGRLSPAGARLLGRALRLRDVGKAQDAVLLFLQPQSGSDADEEAALLDFGAGLADRAGLTAEAMEMRRTLIQQYPNALETPPSMLALARALEDQPDGLVEAKHLLEQLVVNYPRSALVPQARRELDLINARLPRS